MLDRNQYVLDKEAESGRDSLSPIESKIFHIYRFITFYENGGLSGFLYNTDHSPDEIQFLIQELEPIRTDLIRYLNKLVPILTKPHKFTSGTLDEFLHVIDPDDEISNIDSEIQSCYEVLWEDLEGLG